MKYFKKYTATATYFNEDTKLVHSFLKVINLFEVESYIDADNKLEGFNDKIKRTVLLFFSGKSCVILTPFVDFDDLFTEAMKDSQLMDLSVENKKKDDLIPFEAKWKHKGDVKYTFVRQEKFIACRVLPKNYNAIGKSFEEMMSNSIESNIIHFS